MQTAPSYFNFLTHLHPSKVSTDSIKFNRTFGLGGMALLLFIIQVLTGLLLRMVYVPTVLEAYDSILLIENNVLLGGFVRSLHYWGGIFFVIITFLHFIRVFYAQAFFGSRSHNWIIGIILLVLTIFSNFTGYLLPWDQLSYWAVTIATNMLNYFPGIGEWMRLIILGSNEIGAATLLYFYNFHTGILPIAMFLLMLWHFWKVRKAKGVAIPQQGDNKRVAVSNLILKEFVTGLILLAVLFMTAALLDAPLQQRASPTLSPNPAKAPWYFMGIQELLIHLHPFFSVILLPILIFTGLTFLPFFIKNGRQGIWFHSETGKKLSIYTAILSFILTPLLVIVSDRFEFFRALFPAFPNIVVDGLFPILLLVIIIASYLGILSKKYNARKHELTIVLFTIVIVSYISLTILGIWFRGENMQLIWPINL